MNPANQNDLLRLVSPRRDAHVQAVKKRTEVKMASNCNKTAVATQRNMSQFP